MPRNKTSGPPNSSCTLIQQPSVFSHNSPGYTTPIPESSLPSSPAWDPLSRTPSHNSPGYTTPIPESSLPSSPDWDASSRTPQPYSDNAESLACPNPLPNPFNEGQVLLDLRLLGAQLRVSVTGGKYEKKELTASIFSIDGRLIIQRPFHKSIETLLPEWVTPKYPNPTRDNGLLVVIKGDHCGKYVRRIHHRYEGEEAVVILAVVNRVAGHVDSLTGEKLGLDVSHLCVCEEPKEDKRLNCSLMNSLREEARKTRAK
jgi:hypothetical protein